MTSNKSKSWTVLQKTNRTNGSPYEKLGPFQTEDVLQKLKSNEVNASDLIWSAGMSQWTPIKDVEDFKMDLNILPTKEVDPALEKTVIMTAEEVRAVTVTATLAKKPVIAGSIDSLKIENPVKADNPIKAQDLTKTELNTKIEENPKVELKQPIVEKPSIKLPSEPVILEAQPKVDTANANVNENLNSKSAEDTAVKPKSSPQKNQPTSSKSKAKKDLSTVFGNNQKNLKIAAAVGLCFAIVIAFVIKNRPVKESKVIQLTSVQEPKNTPEKIESDPNDKGYEEIPTTPRNWAKQELNNTNSNAHLDSVPQQAQEIKPKVMSQSITDQKPNPIPDKTPIKEPQNITINAKNTEPSAPLKKNAIIESPKESDKPKVQARDLGPVRFAIPSVLKPNSKLIVLSNLKKGSPFTIKISGRTGEIADLPNLEKKIQWKASGDGEDLVPLSLFNAPTGNYRLIVSDGNNVSEKRVFIGEKDAKFNAKIKGIKKTISFYQQQEKKKLFRLAKLYSKKGDELLKASAKFSSNPSIRKKQLNEWKGNFYKLNSEEMKSIVSGNYQLAFVDEWKTISDIHTKWIDLVDSLQQQRTPASVGPIKSLLNKTENFKKRTAKLTVW